MKRRRIRRPTTKPKTLHEWAEQAPGARVTRRELVRILAAVVATLEDDAERDGETGTPEGGA